MLIDDLSGFCACWLLHAMRTLMTELKSQQGV